ncbi:hypothetical protein HYS48_03200 [Candidatus Woesearchaeota archaeon]|nr:hypothetical protein [Candidatus Woesearchaeota archaeon]
MAMKKITITEEAYELLKQWKLKGETFSDAIRRLAK